MVPLIFHHLAIGFVLSYPAVLTPAITGNTSNGTEVRASKGEASWIGKNLLISVDSNLFFDPSKKSLTICVKITSFYESQLRKYPKNNFV